jgi:hypothetical protein
MTSSMLGEYDLTPPARLAPARCFPGFHAGPTYQAAGPAYGKCRRALPGSDEASFITGVAFPVDGGQSAYP